MTGTATEGGQLPRDSDLSPGLLLQSTQPSASLGVIGRRSAFDLGAIGDNLGGLVGNSGGTHDQFHTLQLLEAALHRLPRPKDSERVKRYVPVCVLQFRICYSLFYNYFIEILNVALIINNFFFWHFPETACSNSP